MNVLRHLTFLILCSSWAILSPLSRAADILPPGHRPAPPGIHVLVNARIIPEPGKLIESGTIVIRDGLIEAVGAQLTAPAEAQRWDMSGTTIYAGFIDPYLVTDDHPQTVSTSKTEPIQDLTAGIGFYGVPGAERDPGERGPGPAYKRIEPQHRMVESYGPTVKLLEELHELGFTAASVTPAHGVFRGSSALVNLSEANPNDAILKPDVFQHVAFDTDNPDRKAYPRSLMGVIAAIRQIFLDADYYRRDWDHYATHPARVRPSFDPALAALQPVLQHQRRVILEAGSALMIDRAARLAQELGLDYCLVSCGQEWRRADLAAATHADFIVPLNFPEIPKLPEEADWAEVSLDQLRTWDWAPENPAVLGQQHLRVSLTTFGLGDRKQFRKNLQLALERGWTETDALAALTTRPAGLCGVDAQLGTIAPGKIANLCVVAGPTYFDPKNKIREVWIDGRIYPIKNEVKSFAAPRAGEEEKKPEAQRPELRLKRVARSPSSTHGPLRQPKGVLVRGATIWTCGGAGRLDNADLLIVDGKVKSVGSNLTLPEGTELIDGRNRHVTPGLIDAHNHSMILGGVNEGTLPSTAMVRVSDVVNSETANIQRQLAGGLTVANLLHGSANPIGGQNCIIKLRDGAAPEELKLAGAPPGIKFALGENVKQSNWGEENTTRFPQTRMGVRTFMANRFTAARQYLAQTEAADGRPRRRDLELEALGEILQGRRWIHCHSYRQDEILTLLRLMESFGVKVGTLQHVLEGYKIADEISRHGAGASCFSDWWAYKFEVYDAIPYAGSLMRERGVVVSFNSDSSDLARRLYLEAAKAVKYGRTPEDQALDFVTLNPARQLRIDQWVGSLEPGKDGDFAIWSGSPLESSSRCLQTWIDGKLYFDRDEAERRAESLRTEREQLIVQAKKVLKQKPADKPATAAEEQFFHVALEHQYDHTDRHCLEEEDQ